MKLRFAIILLMSTYALSFSQKAPIKFGEVSKELLELKTYDKDTSCAAVIICDYGKIFENEGKFSRILRIKFFKKEGLSLANHIFTTSLKADLRGYTYNLENGEIVKEKLSLSSIFSEHVFGEIYHMRVAMPNVKVGSVIDIEFSSFGVPSEWHFQERVPVMWSELDLGYMASNYFRTQFFGLEKLFISEGNRWVAKDMPAFKEEPFMSSANNYMTKLEIEPYTYTQSWDKICYLFYNYKFFEGALNGAAYLSKTADEIKAKKLTSEDEIKAAFEAVKVVKWNGEQRQFASYEDLSFVYKHKIGNSADINFMLIQLLRKLGYNSNPVMLSTRENGMLSVASPSISKLNHIIACVETKDKVIYLDATEEFMPYDLLPEKCLNWQGILVKKELGKWVDIKPVKKEKELSIFNLVLTKDLELSGKENCIRYDYAAYKFRKRYFSFNGNDEFLSDFLKDKPGWRINHSEIKNIENYNLPVEDQYEITTANQINQIGEEYFLSPFLYEQVIENPFKNENRKFPVDFAFGKDKTISVNIIIPEEFEVIELPKSVKISMTDGKGYFFYTSSQLNSQLIINFKLVINKILFMPEEYLEIKEFYNQIVKKQAEQIILKKKI